MANKLRFTLSVLAAFLLTGLFMAPAIAAKAVGDGSEDVFNSAIIGEVWLDIPNLSWTPIDDVALTACEPHPRSPCGGHSCPRQQPTLGPVSSCGDHGPTLPGATLRLHRWHAL